MINNDSISKTVTVSSKPRGLGDTIASITKAVGIKPCGGCKKRQEWLNEKFPYVAQSDEQNTNKH